MNKPDIVDQIQHALSLRDDTLGNTTDLERMYRGWLRVLLGRLTEARAALAEKDATLAVLRAELDKMTTERMAALMLLTRADAQYSAVLSPERTRP